MLLSLFGREDSFLYNLDFSFTVLTYMNCAQKCVPSLVHSLDYVVERLD
jgi:hypothetical protein